MTDVLFVFVTDGAEYHQGLAMISAVVRRAGFTSSLCTLDLRTGEDAMRKHLEDTIDREDHSLIAWSAMSCHWDVTRRAMGWGTARTDAPVLAGGWHATIDPEQVMREPLVDYCCLGEGEEATVELLRALKSGADTTSLSNVWARRNRTIVRNELRPPLADLDQLPFPDRELFAFSDLLERNAMSIMGDAGPPRVAPLSAGRGCPHRCSYCSNAAWMDRYGLPARHFVRRRSVPSVMDEVDFLVRTYQPRWLEFWDEDFTVNREWLREFCRAYPSRSPLPFAVLARPNNVTAEEFNLLRQAGCGLVFMGIETGDQELRYSRLKRKVSDEQIVRAFSAAREAGVPTVSFNMVGLPWETKATMEATVRLNEVLRPDFFLCFTYLPFPNTELYTMAEQAGLLKPGLASNYGGSQGANVGGVDEEALRATLERARDLQQELAGERARRYPLLFSPS